jgi:hydrogenase maturation protein HypF
MNMLFRQIMTGPHAPCHMSASPVTPSQPWVRRRIRVRGVVQGVGFRPYVHRLAVTYGLVGFVGNDDDGVHAEVQGAADAVLAFCAALPLEAPPASVVRDVIIQECPPALTHGFTIMDSSPRRGGTVPVSPDLATCADCWREFHDPADRRYHYPFLNCTQCGPRYTIIEDMPYDRPRTTMGGVRMCATCQAEYDAPTSRRFHAQPNACPACGPQLVWSAPGAEAATRDSALAAARQALREGAILAVKGVGGYHLVCAATQADTVQRLRDRKRRPDKPLALLADSVATIESFAIVTEAERALLHSPAHPIVLLARRPGALLPDTIAPGADTIGVMLPYTPLHALLAADGPLVCTSGNLADEPICWDDADARDRLGPLIDGLLAHDRAIAVPCDDSVVQCMPDGTEQPLRRSRGYAPLPVVLPAEMLGRPSVLAVGAELKSTLAITRDRYAVLSAHLGDVGDPLTLEALARNADHMLRLHDITPARVACDLHPGYLSSRWAREYAASRGLPCIPVQHHHAHLASLLAEHAMPVGTPALVFTFDGTGYGPDHSVWGGEALIGDYRRADRVASLRAFPLPGGDSAVKHPSRVALALLHALDLPWHEALAPVREYDTSARTVLATQLDRSLGTVRTSSVGRLLDACAALAGGRQATSYEGQAAIEFEVLARQHVISHGERDRYGMALHDAGTGFLTIDPLPMVEALVADVLASRDIRLMAYHVHAALAQAIVQTAHRLRSQHGALPVGLSGGVFQNRLLQGLVAARLVEGGVPVLQHHIVPVNDGGLALGQALVAAHADLSSTISPPA